MKDRVSLMKSRSSSTKDRSSSTQHFVTFGPMAFLMALTALLMPRRKISGSWVEYLARRAGCWGRAGAGAVPEASVVVQEGVLEVTQVVEGVSLHMEGQGVPGRRKKGAGSD